MKEIVTKKYSTSDGSVFASYQRAMEHEVTSLMHKALCEGDEKLTAARLLRSMATDPAALVEALGKAHGVVAKWPEKK